jgi:hypothetical protein
MTETLLSPSNVLLFGRKVEDLAIVPPRMEPAGNVRRARLVLTTNITPLQGPQTIDGITVANKDRVLVTAQAANTDNGIYVADTSSATAAWTRAKDAKKDKHFVGGMDVNVTEGTLANMGYWKLVSKPPVVGTDPIIFEKANTDPRHGPFTEPRRGAIGDVEAQLTTTPKDDAEHPCFARIYGFSYEGTYYELLRPALFLVHGEGYAATEARTGAKGVVRAARGLGSPSLTGLAAADFEFAEDLMVWSYDKADYTIRMDVETGQFEDILLPMIGGGGGPGVSGARVSGARVSGARVSGARVSGARLSGSRGDAGD